MKYNIKTYRYLANVFVNHYNGYNNGKVSYQFLMFSLLTKLRFSDNVHKVNNLKNELRKLIGDDFDLMLAMLQIALENKSNKYINEYLTMVSKSV